MPTIIVPIHRAPVRGGLCLTKNWVDPLSHAEAGATHDGLMAWRSDRRIATGRCGTIRFGFYE